MFGTLVRDGAVDRYVAAASKFDEGMVPPVNVCRRPDRIIQHLQLCNPSQIIKREWYVSDKSTIVGINNSLSQTGSLHSLYK